MRDGQFFLQKIKKAPAPLQQSNKMATK